MEARALFARTTSTYYADSAKATGRSVEREPCSVPRCRACWTCQNIHSVGHSAVASSLRYPRRCTFKFVVQKLAMCQTSCRCPNHPLSVQSAGRSPTTIVCDRARYATCLRNPVAMKRKNEGLQMEMSGCPSGMTVQTWRIIFYIPLGRKAAGGIYAP
ncbi:hypothetical protein BV20DRAFT_593639 [Pilatotrama ljubarskyi]|nr:hypothetical protein BV20DRAFT_593639 [Pilatotrama ljubarskyi]